MIQDDQTWAAQAACATVEPDQLFGKGAEQRDARSLCFACPVRMECLAEALNSLYKTELIRNQGPWEDIDAVEVATAEWVHWVGTIRPHSTIGMRTPAEHEAA